MQDCGSNPVEEYYKALKAQGKSEDNAKCLSRPVRQLSDFLGLSGKTLFEAEATDVENWLKLLAAMGCCDRTRQAKLALVRVFYRSRISLRFTDFDPTAFSRVPKTWSNVRYAISEAQLAEYLDQAREKAESSEASLLDVRNWALLEFLYGCGARATETAKIQNDDLSLDDIDVLLHGKRSKDRLSPITDAGCEAVARYLKEARPELQKRNQGPPDHALFLSEKGRGLSRQMIWKIVKAFNPDLYPHLLRHCFAQHRADHGERIENIAEDLGQSCLTSTAIYTPAITPEQLLVQLRRYHPHGRDSARRVDRSGLRVPPLGGGQTIASGSGEELP